MELVSRGTPRAIRAGRCLLRSRLPQASFAIQQHTDRAAIGFHHGRLFSTGPFLGAPSAMLSGGSSQGGSATYFQRPSLPANTIIRFVPQQTAWVVERMGKFNRILEPGLAILIPFLDRIAYVQSLKESAIEIPSQSAITADNVTLDLDGVLYTRVFDAYKARYEVELSLPWSLY